jgi:predicted Zn-dependent protease
MLVLSLGVGACDGAGDAAAGVLLPPQEEEKLGDKVERKFLDSDVELYRGNMVENYVKNLGAEAVKAASEDTPEAIEYEFGVIDEPETVNAFAMPGGQIYFYTGLLKEADNQSEVMAVISHEVAHVSQRHIAKQLVLAYGLQAVAEAAVGENPGLVGQLATALVAQGALLTFSREQESEADEFGFDYAVDAGYHPEGFVTFFRKLDERREIEPPTWLSSHPDPGDRADEAEDRIGDKSYDDKTVGEEVHREIVRQIEGSGGGSGDGPSDETGTTSEVDADSGF